MRKLMLAIWMMAAGTCFAQQIDLKALDKFAALASGKTEINMDEATLKSAVGFLNESNAGEALAKKSATNLKGLFLRSYEFSQKGVFKIEDIKPLVDQLKGPNWTSILRNQEADEQTEIWLHRTNGQTDGLLLISAESNELTVINAIGIARLEDLSVLGEFGKLAAEKNLKQEPPKPAGQKDDD